MSTVNYPVRKTEEQPGEERDQEGIHRAEDKDTNGGHSRNHKTTRNRKKKEQSILFLLYSEINIMTNKANSLLPFRHWRIPI